MTASLVVAGGVGFGGMPSSSIQYYDAVLTLLFVDVCHPLGVVLCLYLLHALANAGIGVAVFHTFRHSQHIHCISENLMINRILRSVCVPQSMIVPTQHMKVSTRHCETPRTSRAP